jgi:bifunctional non-homologous end joining protein LigD
MTTQARPIASLTISFGLVAISVKLYSATVASERVSFNLLRQSDGSRVRQLRNDRTSTAVAVLSTRAREGAPVSMPIHWKEVRKGLEPKRFALRSVPPLLKKTKPWADYAKATRSLKAAIRSLTRK